MKFEEFDQLTPEIKEKPKTLYHGSRHKNIEELEPRRKSHRDPEEGELIFATQDLALATIFMASGLCPTDSGRFGNTPYVIFRESREKFIENDYGGHIYILPSDTFTTDRNKGLGTYEWTSQKKVKPLDKIEFTSALDAMLENGVQVYFADEEIFRSILDASDHGYSILKSLESENKRRTINVKEF